MTKKASTAARRPGRLSAEDAAELPDRLLDAALLRFTAQGFAKTTMEQIAKEAGASTKTLYSRYANKEELLHAVVSRVIEHSLAAHAATISADPRQADPSDFLNSLGRQIAIGISGEAVGLIQLAFSEARHQPQLAEMYNGTLARGRSIFRHALECWQEQGLLPDLHHLDRAAGLAISMISDPARVRTALGQPMSKAEIDAHVPYAVVMFLRACGYTPKKK